MALVKVAAKYWTDGEYWDLHRLDDPETQQFVNGISNWPPIELEQDLINRYHEAQKKYYKLRDEVGCEVDSQCEE